ncbi:hypothetical protein K7X08_028235 [Anisodus acutangulus]|uniref:Mannosyltransferase n=1 Tax=Anisodus acutangulus TaxID=402998 RepID=A0A9Q1MUE9_9SOLA|nr:hypothetical protein K7X08_028235 [Anisodus acutangulus]
MKVWALEGFGVAHILQEMLTYKSDYIRAPQEVLDEHWQVLEVAHQISFGYGHLTWEWEKGIRSCLHPMIFAALYKVLAFFHLDKPWFMIRIPRLLQSVFSAFGDLYLFKLSQEIFGDRVAKFTLFSQLTNWFMFFCITRTLSNSLETVLTIVSLYYWPCIRPSASKISWGSRKWALAIAALACAIRPTSDSYWGARTLILGLTFLVDRWMGLQLWSSHSYRFRFLAFSSKQWKLSSLVAWSLAIYSLLGHKEFRNNRSTYQGRGKICVHSTLTGPHVVGFHGVCPPCASNSFNVRWYWLTTIGGPDKSNGRGKRSPSTHDGCSIKLQLAILFLAVTNIPMAFYMSMVHQRGTEDVMNYLSEEAYRRKVKSIVFFTPCHATPYYSTLHRNLPMCFLDCTPSEEKRALDESDRFLVDPVGFATEFAKNWSTPSHIVLFDSQEKLLKEFLALHNFQEIKWFFHAHFKVDRELQASVAVYTWKGQ